MLWGVCDLPGRGVSYGDSFPSDTKMIFGGGEEGGPASPLSIIICIYVKRAAAPSDFVGDSSSRHIPITYTYDITR